MSMEQLKAQLDALDARVAALEAALAERRVADELAAAALAQEVRALRAPLERVASRQGGEP